jgi:hypothetical protein
MPVCPPQNPTRPDLGSNPGRRGGKPATNIFHFLPFFQWNIFQYFSARSKEKDARAIPTFWIIASTTRNFIIHLTAFQLSVPLFKYILNSSFSHSFLPFFFPIFLILILADWKAVITVFQDYHLGNCKLQEKFFRISNSVLILIRSL